MTSGSTNANEKLKKLLKAGKLFEGKYRIMKPLGAGSFAVVVHARHEVMGRDVALKFLKPKVVESNPEVSERFIKEVQIASRLKHPNVVAIYDFGKTDDGIYYMVQEYVDGVTVDDLMPPGRPMRQDRALMMINQALDCLKEAHIHGIIHRDLKPSNLMATKDENGNEIIKILDFGVAKLLDKEDKSTLAAVRQSTKFIGTPIYMSPEQILGRGVSAASDLYSVGLMTYEMLTGQPPIQAEQIAEVVQQHLSDSRFDFPMLHLLEPNLQRVILKATERHSDMRFQTADDFIQALEGDWEEAAKDTAKTEVASSDLVAASVSPPPTLNEKSSESEDLSAFLGQNYIGLDEADDAPSFLDYTGGSSLGDSIAAGAGMDKPDPEFLAPDFDSSARPRSQQGQRRKKQRPPQRPTFDSPTGSGLRDSPSASGLRGRPNLPRDPAPSAPSVPSTPSAPSAPSAPTAPTQRTPRRAEPAKQQASSSTSSLTDANELELDMDAMRSVRRQRQRSTDQDRDRGRKQANAVRKVVHEHEHSAPARYAFYAGGALAFYITFVLLSVIMDGTPAVVRVLIGLSPLPLSLAWVKFEPRSVGTLADRWLVPVSIRGLILMVCAFLLITGIFPSKAAIAFKHEGVWFLEAFPEVPPFTWVEAVTALLTSGLASFFEQVAKLLPW